VTKKRLRKGPFAFCEGPLALGTQRARLFLMSKTQATKWLGIWTAEAAARRAMGDETGAQKAEESARVWAGRAAKK